jgi:hypothetical protein
MAAAQDHGLNEDWAYRVTGYVGTPIFRQRK